MEASRIGNIIKQTNLGKRISSGIFTKPECKKCHKPMTWEEAERGLCNKCMAPILKAKQDKRLKEIKEKIRDLLASRGVPKRYLDCTLDSFQTIDISRKRVLSIVRKYTEKPASNGEGLFLTGSNGTGKTHLAIAVMRELILSDQLSCYFIKVPDLLLNIREHIGDGLSEKEIIEKYKGYSYLFLDELGVEKVSEWVLQDLYLILDGRSGALEPTIITSNLGLEEIEEHIGSRFVSRIVEMCKSVVMEFEDWRKLSRRKKVKE